MRVLVTGSDGYIGAVLMPLLRAHGHAAIGLDTGYYSDCSFGPAPPPPELRMDVRDVGPAELEGIDAVIHLAALSNDPVGDLNPSSTYAINRWASTGLAKAAAAGGASRFLFSSSCSLYGASDGTTLLDEGAQFNPVTPYGESKVLSEQDIGALATDDFSPTFLRNATVYGSSPRLRGDVVVNNLVGRAFTTGKVMMESDGTPWRPLVHVDDVCSAFLTVLEADREVVHGQAFNVGQTSENYRIRDVAEIVRDVVVGSEVSFAASAGPDSRNYRVNFDKIADALPGWRPTGTVRSGAEELLREYTAHGMSEADLLGPRYQRLPRIRQRLDAAELDNDLRWTSQPDQAG
jgi:nucleoside-diphosphate-sugar epimerase